MSDAQYYYAKNNQRLGPVSVMQLKQLAATGQLLPSDLIWTQGMASWEPASKAQGLFTNVAASAGAPVAAPPPATPTPGPAPTAGPAAAARPFTAPGPAPQAPPPGSQPAAGPQGAGPQFGSQASAAVMSAGNDAMKALQVLLKNPVAGMRESYELLGPKRAMLVGIVFAGVFYVCLLLAAGIMLGRLFSILDFGNGLLLVIRLVVLGLVPIGAVIGGCAVARAMFRSEAGIQADLYVAGASLAPLAAALLIGAVFGLIVAEIAMLAELFGFCLLVLMLYSGLTTIHKIPEAAATLAVPIILSVSGLVASLLFRAPMMHG